MSDSKGGFDHDMLPESVEMDSIGLHLDDPLQAQDEKKQKFKDIDIMDSGNFYQSEEGGESQEQPRGQFSQGAQLDINAASL